MSQRKHLPISRHQTLNGVLEVDWLQDYKGEFVCPQCNQGRLNKAYFSAKSNGVRLGCNSCGQYTHLSCTSQRKHLPISRHQTLNGILEVNWLQDYKGEFVCPQCNQGSLTKAYFSHKVMVLVLDVTPVVNTLPSPVKILLTSTTIKQTWNALTLFVLALVQGVKGDGFINMTI
jgi:transcription elongation factor Elf1